MNRFAELVECFDVAYITTRSRRPDLLHCSSTALSSQWSPILNTVVEIATQVVIVL